MSKKEKSTKRRGKGKTILIAIIVLLVIGAIGNIGNDKESVDTPHSVNENLNDDFDESSSDGAVIFELVAGEEGEYGKKITYNEGTDFEESFYAYYIPAESYTVTNTGEYPSQISVYSDETITTAEGWEEPAQTFVAELVDVGESIAISIENGQHIEIVEPSIFRFEMN